MILVYEVGNVICAGVFGTDVLALGLYYFILNIFLFLEHSNLHYPNWLNKSLGLFFVTPDQHRVHHQQDQFYTDSNFADIFIIWDRIFGTYKTLPVEKMKYGLAEFEGTKKTRISISDDKSLYKYKKNKIRQNITGRKSYRSLKL
jgi:sterol desaturase/sphingolipid hydroxylase (fatty acid hydroxylase superfamily)